MKIVPAYNQIKSNKNFVKMVRILRKLPDYQKCKVCFVFKKALCFYSYSEGIEYEIILAISKIYRFS